MGRAGPGTSRAARFRLTMDLAARAKRGAWVTESGEATRSAGVAESAGLTGRDDVG